jgi:hypothetical protein
MDKTLYFNEGKDYKKLLQDYFTHTRSKDWLNGYVSCLYASMIIDNESLFELNCFIKELKEIEEVKVNV